MNNEDKASPQNGGGLHQTGVDAPTVVATDSFSDSEWDPINRAVVNEVGTEEVEKTSAELAVLTDEELANAINEGHQRIESGIHSARKHAWMALIGALRAGPYLQESLRRCKAKRIEWRDWINLHCPLLGLSTAYRYIDLAKRFPHVRNPSEITNLRQAYLVTGILPDGPKKERKKPDLQKIHAFTGTDVVARVKTLRTFLAAGLGKFEVTTLEKPVRNSLKKEIAALIAELIEFKGRVESADAKPKGSKGGGNKGSATRVKK
jgi:hypothetical protein